MLPPYTQSVTQLTLDLDEETARQIDEAAARAGRSRTEWAQDILAWNASGNRLPQWWFDNLGTWEDHRTVEEIIADMDNVPRQRPREPFDETPEQPLPESWFAALGTLEDPRTADEIIADIDNVPSRRPRAELD